MNTLAKCPTETNSSASMTKFILFAQRSLRHLWHVDGIQGSAGASAMVNVKSLLHLANTEPPMSKLLQHQLTNELKSSGPP